jgi:hypothetical protein
MTGKTPPGASCLSSRPIARQEEFRKSLTAALEAERADEVQNVVWLGDGASENRKMVTELCACAVKRVDLPHTIQNGMACG